VSPQQERQPAAPASGTCGYCARRKRLDAAGRLPVHYLTIPVTRRAVPAVGAGRVRRVCAGSGRPPRETTR
jgi:hypothetical protein